MSSNAAERLPCADRARVDREKIVHYLSNPAKSRGKAEFLLEGETAAVLTLRRGHVRPIRQGEIAHARERVSV